ncbi:MAG: ATP-dependent exoDNAse [Segetibacter sp.]|nr:ATP-dependent exoDNAse [Segetibacter sp.]
MKKSLLFVLLISVSVSLTAGDDFCSIRNNSFSAGENISLVVFYNALGLYVNAGTANFTVTTERLNNKPVYHIIGTGVTNSKYDWIFKVRDRYETYIDTTTLRPYKFIRNVDEGGYKKYENITFNHTANTALSTQGVYKVPNCIQDVVSSMYYSRNIDFNKYKAGDKIPFTIFLDNEVYNMYIRYQGKEIIKTRYGKFRAIVFKPLLVKGTLFEGGEKMTVYVSDDANKVPLRIESPLLVGSVKVDLMSYQNLRYPLTSLISFR